MKPEPKMSDLPALDRIQRFMLDKTGYFVDVAKEEKYFLIGTGTMVKAEATDAEMKLWAAWEAAERGSMIAMNMIAGKLDNIINNLDRAKAAEAEDSCELC